MINFLAKLDPNFIEIGNFTISLNNPSSQIETQELDDLNRRLAALQTALSDPGTGIPMMSLHKGLKDIMKMSDSEIKDMLNEIRLEKAMAAELAATANIIKKTGIFDSVDRIYGDYEAMNNPQAQQAPTGEDEGMGGGSMGGAPIGPGDMGDDIGMDIGEPGADEEGDVGGDMGTTDMSNAPSADIGEPLMENKKEKMKRNESIKSFTSKYFGLLNESLEKESKLDHHVDTINNVLNEVCSKIDLLVNEEEFERECIVNEAIENSQE